MVPTLTLDALPQWTWPVFWAMLPVCLLVLFGGITALVALIKADRGDVPRVLHTIGIFLVGLAAWLPTARGMLMRFGAEKVEQAENTDNVDEPGPAARPGSPR